MKCKKRNNENSRIDRLESTENNANESKVKRVLVDEIFD